MDGGCAGVQSLSRFDVLDDTLDVSHSSGALESSESAFFF